MQDKTLHNVGTVIDALKKHYGFRSNAELERFMGIKEGLLSVWKNRNSIADEQPFLTKCKINYQWLRTGEGEMFQGQSAGSVREASGKEYAGFHKVGVYAMAGAGSPNSVINEDPIDEIIIPAEWNKPSIIPIKVRGKSMEETINEGAYVGVDRDDKFIVSGKVYAVWLPYEGAVIKRLFLDTEKITLKSDNASFPDILVPLQGLPEHFIQGRVVWVIQKL